ncbi:MAG: hypothetical protein AB7O66_25220 [Limisphaerales bacterium]
MRAKSTVGVRTGAAFVLAAMVWIGSPPEAAEAAAAGPGNAAAGLEALKASRFGEARQAFTQVLSDAGLAEDAVRIAEAHFYLGLTDQQQALSEGDDSRRRGLLVSAEKEYRLALSRGREAAGILNNLARVQTALGRTNDALASLSRAVALNDSRRGFYAENYADLLLAAGRWLDACRTYAMVAAEQPQNRTVHRKMVDACIRWGPDLLPWYLWELAEGGQVVQVLETALGVVGNAVWTSAQREEVMGLVAYCLSRRGESAEEFLASTAARRLRELSADPGVGGGAQGILSLYQATVPDPGQVRWWTRLVRRGEEARRGMWPFEAFLGLVRSLGDRAGAAGDPERQEAYWMLAVSAKPGAPDPEALWLLANLYSDRRDLEALDALLRRYEVDIFQGKGEAYSSSQTEKIYRYHMALGVIYSQLDRWTTPGQVNSAKFQLQRAIETADHLNQQRRSPPGASGAASGPVVVPTRLVDLLASGYEKEGKLEDAIRLRFDQAEKYLAIDQVESAARVMAPVKDAVEPGRGVNLPAGAVDRYRSQWRDVESKIRRAVVPPGDTRNPGSLKVTVAGDANVVAGAGTGRTLTAEERKQLEAAVDSVIRAGEGKRAAGGQGSVVRPLSGSAVGPDVQEVTVKGNQGRVLLRKGTNLVEVPFQVDGKTPTTPKALRYVRP